MADQSEDIDRMHAIWKERGLPKITEQRLCDQARAIIKNEWFTSVELDEIRRRITTAYKELEEQDAGCIDTEPEQVDELSGNDNVQTTDKDTMNDEEMQMIKDIVEIMRSGQVWNGAGFKKVDRKMPADWTKKVNRTTSMTDTNKLVNECYSNLHSKTGWAQNGSLRAKTKEP